MENTKLISKPKSVDEYLTAYAVEIHYEDDGRDVLVDCREVEDDFGRTDSVRFLDNGNLMYYVVASSREKALERAFTDSCVVANESDDNTHLLHRFPSLFIQCVLSDGCYLSYPLYEVSTGCIKLSRSKSERFVSGFEEKNVCFID